MKGKALYLLCLLDAANRYLDVPDFERLLFFFLLYNKGKCFNLGWIFTNVYLLVYVYLLVDRYGRALYKTTSATPGRARYSLGKLWYESELHHSYGTRCLV